MSLIALGINHKTAPVEVRERVAFGNDGVTAALRSIQRDSLAREAVILSTCNRTELYVHSDHSHHDHISQWLHQTLTAPPDTFTPYLFSHSNEGAARHLMRVCSGLDSLVLGEPQILGQVKQAFSHAVDNGTVGPHFQRLFQSAFGAAKQVRTDTQIGANAVSVAYAAVQMAQRLSGDMQRSTVLIVGAGETGALAARHIARSGAHRLIVSNRSIQRASALAAELAEHFPGGVESIALSDLGASLYRADVVFCATGSPLAVLGKGMVESALRRRKREPMLFMDLAVPRDIEPEVQELEDAFVYSVDDLQSLVDQGRQAREEAAVQADHIITQHCDAYMHWVQSASARKIIGAYRQHAHAIRDEQLERARAALRAGRDAEQVLQQLAHGLTNKLLHAPSAALNDASDPQLLQHAEHLLGLDTTTP